MHDAFTCVCAYSLQHVYVHTVWVALFLFLSMLCYKQLILLGCTLTGLYRHGHCDFILLDNTS